MRTVTLSQTTYQWLQRQAKENIQTPDQVADEILRRQLAPAHAYVEVVEKVTGPQAMIKGTRVPVSIIVAYLREGETPESLVENILPHLILAQVYDALSYYVHQNGTTIKMKSSKRWSRIPPSMGGLICASTWARKVTRVSLVKSIDA
jgi:uncharacterized protein (DUF433 family)